MLRTYRKILLLLLALSPPQAPAQPSTKILVYEAYSQENVLNPNVVIAQRYAGTCLTKSVADPGRSDSWRCTSSNLILDPCFQDGSTLACINSPWSHKATILELTTPLNRSPIQKINTQAYQPWAVELENGQHCTILTGASTMIDNISLSYSCKDAQYNIIGNIDKSSPVWKAKLYDFEHRLTRIVAITSAWY